MDLSNTYVIITGHSLGGSVANLLAHDINAAQETAGVSCYTFASANCTEKPQADGNISDMMESIEISWKKRRRSTPLSAQISPM